MTQLGMIELAKFGDEIRVLGDWPERCAFDVSVLGKEGVTATVTVKASNGYAVYEVVDCQYNAVVCERREYASEAPSAPVDLVEVAESSSSEGEEISEGRVADDANRGLGGKITGSGDLT